MKKLTLGLSFVAAAGLVLASCSSDDDQSTPVGNQVSKSAVIENYANIVYQNYKDAYDDAVALETAINTFVGEPTDANFTEAKNKWRDARESYGTTEAFRFANGPIDDENGPEGLLNAWPLDENYIDYVDNNGAVLNGGIINDTENFPEITKDLLISLNEDGGEKNISTGYHAIEFLLWGQDLTAPADNLPGQRAYTDFVDEGGTALNEDRRREYLVVCADLLTDHLSYLVDQWKEGGEYRGVFLALPEDEALQNMYLGITTLAAAELAVERMDVALANMDQEDEHSCFSDNTHRDVYLNYKGVINVYRGEYGSVSGASLEDLVAQADAQTAQDTDAAITTTEASIAAIAIPFDYAISGGATSEEGAKVKAAVLNLQQQLGANLLAGASKLGISVTIE